MDDVSEASKFLNERQDDGRVSAGEYRPKVSVSLEDGMTPFGGGWMESLEIVRTYFNEKSDAEAAYERLRSLKNHGESISLERRRDLSRPFEWILVKLDREI